jgi:nucleoside 2-deoxyribosyltransferase
VEEYKIYTIGKMSGITTTRALKWRKQVEQSLMIRSGKPLNFIHPPEFFNFDMDKDSYEEDEIFNFEMRQLKDTDICIVNLNFYNSTGSNIEMHQAHINDIPIIALWDKDTYHQHPWVEIMVDKSFNTIDELTDYINYYYLF